MYNIRSAFIFEPIIFTKYYFRTSTSFKVVVIIDDIKVIVSEIFIVFSFMPHSYIAHVQWVAQEVFHDLIPLRFTFFQYVMC